MRNVLVLAMLAVIILSGATFGARPGGVSAPLGIAASKDGNIGMALDVTYASRYIWRGFDLYPDDHSAIQSSLDMDLGGSGFHFNVNWSRANGSGHENTEWIPMTLYYVGTCNDDSPLAMTYVLGGTYYNFPDMPESDLDIVDFFAHAKFTNLLGDSGLVPYYTWMGATPASTNALTRTVSGFAHVMGMAYSTKCPETGMPLNFTGELWYNDGMGTGVNALFGSKDNAATEQVDHDFSHAMFSVSTSYDVADNMKVVPAIYHQVSMEDTVNTQDETWFTVSAQISF